MEPLAEVRALLDATEAEYGLLPFFVRPLVRRGFLKRTGYDFAGWRRLLATPTDDLGPALDRLAAHFDGALARARRGLGATAEQLREVERLTRDRAAIVRRARAAM